jgi:hypothetical protein
MGRPDILPTKPPQRNDSKAPEKKPLSRSATTQVPTPAKHRLSIHNPFHHSQNSSNATTIDAGPSRPAMNRQNSIQTRYMTMLLDLDTIPRLHNIYASFFTWILLAGFVIFVSYL